MIKAVDIENMTIAEYMEYEAELKKKSRSSAWVSHLKDYEGMDFEYSHHKKNIVMDYPHYSYDAKTDTYYDLPSLLLCFQPVQPHHKPHYADVKSVTDSMVTYESEGDKKGHDKYAKENVNEWFKMKIETFKRMQQKKDQECRETRRQIQAACLKN
uniref:Uncharacterized protein n=1 Tax=Tanacetum cinerariifolium TaxID=118510 RepID=A0A6L2JDH2_TANCI|nr:hypothetical protein [Tanacetum cinerariifolium]